MEVADETVEVAGLPVHLRRAGDTPILYLHGVPTHSVDWLPFLERHGGIAPDLPGFGRSAKPGDFDYSIGGYARFLEALVDELELDRFALVMHDWGAVGLALAQRLPERIERVVTFPIVPFVPGYRWHRLARGWRTPLLGELLMGFATRTAFRRGLPPAIADAAWERFDHSTQRAILRLYRSAPPDVLEAAGERLNTITAPALVAWGVDDPYISADFAQRVADALGGPAEVELIEDGRHWTWFGRPETVELVTDFLQR